MFPSHDRAGNADILMGNYDQFGSDFSSSVAGPDIATFDDVARLFSTLTDFDSQGKKLNYHKRVMRELLSFLNRDVIPKTLYTKYAFDHYFYNNMMQKIDPSYMARHKQLLNKQTQGNIPLIR